MGKLILTVWATLWLVFAPTLQAAGTPRPDASHGDACGKAHRTSSAPWLDSHLSAQAATGLITESFQGGEARAHLERLRQRDGKLKAAEAQLRARGYTPTETVVVMRQIARTPLTDADSGDAKASVSNSEGEVIFSSWDDGDDSTWEGVIHVERYSDGKTVSKPAQLDISTAQPHVIWEGGGGAGIPDKASEGELTRKFGWNNFMLCSLGFCMTCGELCTLGGPVWGTCFSLCCVTAIIGCAMREL